MNVLILSFSYLRNKFLNTALNLLLLAFGVGIIVFLILVTRQANDQLRRNIKGINLVIGAKGSPLQIILCSIYHLDNPTGNISLDEANRIAQDSSIVAKAIPMSLGDNYQGHRIVGTTHAYPAHYQATLAAGVLWQKPMEVVLGVEVARKTGLKLGSTFAGAHGLGAEALHQHEEKKFVVVGILRPSQTVLDQVILTSLESIWEVHEEHTEDKDTDHDNHSDANHDHEDKQKQATTSAEAQKTTVQQEAKKEIKQEEKKAVEVDSKTEASPPDSSQKSLEKPKLRYQMPKADEPKKQQVTTTEKTQATQQTITKKVETTEKKEEYKTISLIPVKKGKEITALLVTYRNPRAALMLPRYINTETNMQAAVPASELNRLLSFIGLGADMIRAFALVVVLISALSIFIALFNALKERRYDLAIMRTLGASQLQLLWAILLEGLMLSVVGAALGGLLGHGSLAMLSAWSAQSAQVQLEAWQWVRAELFVYGGVVGIGILTALLPALQVYKIDISKTLAQ
ncbi:MAG TPA: hypothetical protein DCM08_03890 [Microscillaceae bacterium]|nr:hypothetical protein [Microscillaceae bacterium]